MSKAEAKQRIEKLKKVIKHHRYLYHVLDRQEISDDALDSLKRELRSLEERHPELITPDSPTQRVGGRPLEGFKKVKHRVPMLSIEDVFSEKELRDWEDYLKRLAPSGKFDYFAELKIDGFAISLVYENGLFALGSTRGNGAEGENVTQNLRTIESIPLKLEVCGKSPAEKISGRVKRLIEKGKIEIRGEVYMGKTDFERLNRELEKRGEKTYANPRNLAAGSIRQLDPKVAASRPLKFLAYDIVTDLGQARHSEEHKILPALGFFTDPGKKCRDLKEVFDYWRETAKKRDTLPFQIDGVVVSVDGNFLFGKLGVAGKSHRGARAFKFSPRQATTRVADIRLQVGRTGALTPVAHLKPVEVEGVTITRATLHNEDEMKKLGVRIGDTVIVERAGDVIPAVVKVLTRLRTGKERKFFFPEKCPVCGARLAKPEGEAVWRCPSRNCPAVKREVLYHFVSRKAFNIDGLGPKIIDQLADENLVSGIPDLFELTEGDLIPLERFAEKSAENLVKSINDSKEIPLARFVYALGIRHVGEETAVDLARHFGSIKNLQEASPEDLQKVPDVGGVVAKSVCDWFGNKKNRELVGKLIGAGVRIIPPRKIKKKLEGKTFVFTGGLRSMARDEAKNKVRVFGGEVSSSVSGETDYVVAGESPGSKAERAEKLGVRIVSEKEFLEMIK